MKLFALKAKDAYLSIWKVLTNDYIRKEIIITYIKYNDVTRKCS